MYFAFIDEAGTPGYKEGTRPEGYFSVASMIVNCDNLLNMERKLELLKIDYGIDLREEFKWGGKYSKLGLTFEDQCGFRESMFGIISEIAETVIVSVLDKQACYQKDYIGDHFDLYSHALYLLMERIQQHLGERRQPVVFVIDSRKNNKQSDLDDKLSAAYKKALSHGTYYFPGGFPLFSATAFFAASESSAGLQLADYCAGPVQQYFCTGKNEWYRILRRKIRKSPFGDNKISGYGIKCFPFKPTIPL